MAIDGFAAFFGLRDELLRGGAGAGAGADDDGSAYREPVLGEAHGRFHYGLALYTLRRAEEAYRARPAEGPGPRISECSSEQSRAQPGRAHGQPPWWQHWVLYCH